jgi:predicted ATP-binding protein involved in virulence
VACLRHISPELVALHERGEKAAAPAVRRLRPTKPKPTPGIAHIESGSIRTITIKNFKAIRNLSITLPTGKSERAGWKMLLGENGTGKSSVLQAIAFALMGPELFATHLKRFKLYPKDLLRRKRDGKPANQALIEVEFTTDEKAVLRITKKDFHFITSLKKRFFVRGYGATRLLPRRDAPSQTVKTGIPHKIDNLLSPVVPVFNANDWLVGLRQKQFDSAALALKDLLNLPGRTNISIKARRVLIPINGIRISLDELSAGFESVLSMVADIIAGVVGGSHDLRHAPGIILLDEIDAHLHPRWKMRIVEALRGTFSSMQFIVTTHEPLCLRGLNENEVVVLRRENNELVSLDDLDSPSKLRVDQLLTSELFGLQSTLDPQLDEALSNYYRLLAKPDGELTSKEEEKLEELRKELPPVRVVELLGDSQRERLIYEVVDKYLANELAHRNPTVRQEMKMQTRENVKKRIADIWRSTTTSTTRSEE